jgi:hypothetical protein
MFFEKFVTETFKPKFDGDALIVDQIEWCHNEKLKKYFNQHKLLFHGT